MPKETQRGGGNFPQLGSEGVRQPVFKKGTKDPQFNQPSGSLKTKLNFGPAVDFKDSSNILVATTNVAHALETASPQTVSEGKEWYPKANDLLQTGLQGKGGAKKGFLSSAEDRNLSGAGVLALASPNAEWETSNVNAVKVLSSLSGSQWDRIHSTPLGDSKPAQAAQREAMSPLRGTDLTMMTFGNLHKASRLVQGEHPDKVLDRKTAPKTNSFMHNIADPTADRVTLDGRMYDVATNRSRPWDTGRGLSTGESSRGTTRYEDLTSVVRDVSRRAGLDPSAGQAVVWTHTKGMEMAGVTSAGTPRKTGPPRVGQPYFHAQTGQSAIHDTGSRRAAQNQQLAHLSNQFGL